MRVAYISPYYPIKEQPHRGQSAYQTLLRLQDRAEIQVFCPLSTYPRWAQPRNYPYTRTDLTWQAPGGLRARYIEYPALPGLGRLTNGLVCARAIFDSVQAFAPDVILNYWLYPEGYAAMRVGRRLRVPVVLGSIGSDLNRIPDAVTRHWTRRALSGATMVVTVSEHLRRRAISEFGVPPDRTRRIVNGVDTAIFHLADRRAARRDLGLSDDSRIVLYVGWIAPTKGLAELATAFGELAPRHERLEMILIGEGPMAAELQTAVNGSARFRLAGRRDSREIARWMAAADLFCLPSWAEGCPNVVVEALACGRPVISTEVGGIPELVDAAFKGTLVAPRNPAALAAALDQALSRDWDEAAIAEASRRDWSDCARETEAVCREAIEMYVR